MSRGDFAPVPLRGLRGDYAPLGDCAPSGDFAGPLPEKLFLPVRHFFDDRVDVGECLLGITFVSGFVHSPGLVRFPGLDGRGAGIFRRRTPQRCVA